MRDVIRGHLHTSAGEPVSWSVVDEGGFVHLVPAEAGEALMREAIKLMREAINGRSGRSPDEGGNQTNERGNQWPKREKP